MMETEAADALTAVLDGIAAELRTTKAVYTPNLLSSIHDVIREATELASRLEESRR